jgi:hypothetical protein
MTIPLTLSHIIHAVTSGAARAAEILLHLTPEPRHNAEVAAYRLGYCAARTSGSRSTCAPPPRASSIWFTPLAPSTIGASPPSIFTSGDQIRIIANSNRFRWA